MARGPSRLLLVLLTLLSAASASPFPERKAQIARFQEHGGAAINFDSLRTEVRQATLEGSARAAQLADALRRTFGVLKGAIVRYHKDEPLDDATRSEQTSACTLTVQEAKEDPEGVVPELVRHFAALTESLSPRGKPEELAEAIRELICIRSALDAASPSDVEFRSRTKATPLDEGVHRLLRGLDGRLRTDRFRLDLLDGSIMSRKSRVTGGGKDKSSLARQTAAEFYGLTEEELQAVADGYLEGIPEHYLLDTYLDEFLYCYLNASVTVETLEYTTSALLDVLWDMDPVSPEDSLWDDEFSHGPVCGHIVVTGTGGQIFEWIHGNISESIDDVLEAETVEETKDALEWLTCKIGGYYPFIATTAQYLTDDQLSELEEWVFQISNHLLHLWVYLRERLQQTIEDLEDLYPSVGGSEPPPNGHGGGGDGGDDDDDDDTSRGKKTVVKVETEVTFDNTCCH